jgi:hypothetical protein
MEVFICANEDEVNAVGILSVAAFIVVSVLASNFEGILLGHALITSNKFFVKDKGILSTPVSRLLSIVFVKVEEL